MTPLPREARDASWLVGLPLIIASLHVVAFNAMSLEARRTAGLEAGTCGKPSRAAAIYQMIRRDGSTARPPEDEAPTAAATCSVVAAVAMFP